MGEHNAFESKRESQQPAESPFRDEFRPEQHAESQKGTLQDLSPDKRVVKSLASLSSHEKEQLKDAYSAAAEQCRKVEEPLRNVYNNMMRQEMSGQPGNDKAWAQNYMAKIGEVLRDNLEHISSQLDFRVAIPVQAFLPGANGAMGAEKLYAFFPPQTIGVNERYITMPLVSDDKNRQANLAENPSFANSISWHELEFRSKMAGVIERRDVA